MQQAIPLMLLIAIGYLLRGNFQQPAELGAIKTLVINAALPATILLSLLTIDTHLDLIALPTFALAINFYLLLVSGLLVRWVFSSLNAAKGRALMLMFPSLAPGLTAYPFIEEFLGKPGVAWATLADVGNKVFVLIGLYVLAMYWQQQASTKYLSFREKLWGLGLTLLTEPANVAVIVGLLLVYARTSVTQIPTIPLEVLQKLAVCTTPLILFFVGISLKTKFLEVKLILWVLLARAAAGFGFSAAAIALLHPNSAATATLMAVLPQVGCSLWPLLYAMQMNQQRTDVIMIPVFDTEFALGMLSASIPFSICVVLMMFSGGDFWTSPWHLGMVSAGLGTLFTFLLAVSPIARSGSSSIELKKPKIKHTLSTIEQPKTRGDTSKKNDLLLNAAISKIDISSVLPGRIALPIKRLASWLNLPEECYLTALLTTVSMLHKVGTKLIIHEGMDFDVSPNIFGGIVAESSQKKSPVIKAIAAKPLLILQAKAEEEFKEALADYQIDLAVWEKLSKEAKAEIPRPEEPRQKIYLFTNANGEGIRNQLQAYPQQGLLALVDEIAGLIKNANAYGNGRGSDEEDLLSYYDGVPNITLRAKGLRSSVRQALIAVLGTIQPATLLTLMEDLDDGNDKWARFAFVYQPLAASTMPDDSDSLDLTPMLAALYQKIDNLPPTVYCLTPDALAYYRRNYDKFEQRRVEDGKQAMRAVWGKTEGRIGKLAINLHVIHALSRGEIPSDRIDRQTVKLATKLAKFYAEQVQSLYGDR